MAQRVRLEPAARVDLFEAAAWYAEKADGLGRQFITVFDEAMSTIRDSPEAFPVVFNDVRRMVLRRFPFAVFYVMDESETVVLAVQHERRSPDRWPRG
ncbi:MAG TPA: type II toxin-antitoxin system RelE/ParE family toxin [Myxococcota bacterium]|nr:type II toxin-antitoxin system RelE/ParE family toxin [Myxococcota bacterium]HKK94333.1 type II toxin-antitoxin system RelE/ParE family toxin [Longimicrobiales bacterium]